MNPSRAYVGSTEGAYARPVLLAAVMMLIGTSIMPVAASTTSTQVTLGTPLNLSNDSGLSTVPVIASVGTFVYVAWEDSTNGRTQTYFVTSSNSGATWGPIIKFTGPGSASAVQMAAFGTNVYLTWKQGSNTALVVSTNNGGTFSAVTTFSQSTGSAGGQSLATNGTSVYLSWIFFAANGSSYVMFNASHDSGSTFSTPKVVSKGAGPLPKEDVIAAQGDYVYISWVSMWFTRSPDGGKTFSTPVNFKVLGRISSGGGGEPMIAASANDVYVAFQSCSAIFPPCKHDAFIAASHDRGSTWTVTDITPGLTDARNVQVAACTTSTNQVPCTGTKNVFVTFRGQGITSNTNQYMMISRDNGTTFGAVFDLAVQKGTQVGFGGVAIEGGNVYGVWAHTLLKGVSQIYLQASQDSGASWGGVQQVSTSTASALGMGDGSGSHDQGSVAAASGGHIYIVWQDDSTGNGDVYFVVGGP